MNSCFNHSFLPTELLKGIITPSLKDNNKDNSSLSNYRPVMQSSNILKILEMYFLDILAEKIDLNGRQFGFRKNMSTNHACFTLKNLVNKYITSKYGKVYSCFVDLSQAFDRVDHFILGEKLLDKDIPCNLINILMSYLRNQTASVSWNNCFSNFRYIEFGVRQGGILSPFLFNFYINNILERLSVLDEGCMFGLSRVNVIAYADDVVLISNNLHSLDIIYRDFEHLISHSKLKINESKSKCMNFEAKNNFNNENSITLGNK